MSSRHPATVHYSLEEFSRHGGLSGPHKDGWGIAWYEDGDVRLLKEREPASDSACVRLVREHPIESRLVVSHIRTVTQGALALRNCQPFTRELGGAMHVFAHNGDLDPVALRAARRQVRHGRARHRLRPGRAAGNALRQRPPHRGGRVARAWRWGGGGGSGRIARAFHATPGSATP